MQSVTFTYDPETLFKMVRACGDGGNCLGQRLAGALLTGAEVDVFDEIGLMFYSVQASKTPETFQARNAAWLSYAMADDPTDLPERVARFGEEALELQQALGQSREDAHALVDYVFDRPVGEPAQEMGGTMTTLALLAVVAGLDMAADGERELARCSTAAVLAKIRGKRATRAGRGPLPGVTPTPDTGPDPVEAYPVRLLIADEVDEWPEGWRPGDPPTVSLRYVAAPVVKRSHSG